jgi:preprotein translocase subunit SecD
MIDWPLAFSTASQAIKLVNDLRGIEKQFDQAELKLKIANLSTALADLKMTLTDARDELTGKDAEIARLKKMQQRVVDETVELYGYRYRKRKSGPGLAAGNPFCDVCFQKEGLLIETSNVPGKGIMAQQCPNCKAVYGQLHTFTG